MRSFSIAHTRFEFAGKRKFLVDTIDAENQNEALDKFEKENPKITDIFMIKPTNSIRWRDV